MIKINYEAIADIESIIKQMQLISSKPLSSKFKIITKFDEAYNNAFIRRNYVLYGEQGYTWENIKSKMISDVKKIIYQDENYKQIDEELSKITIPALEMLEININEDAIFDEVYSDLMLCVESRGIMGKENKFFEEILSAYEIGGWPCGWEGNYPDGEMIVYFRIGI